MTFSLRPAASSDMALVYGSWVDSYQRTLFARSCGQAYRGIQDAIAKRHARSSAVLVCCLADDHETIVGWSMTDAYVVHYVFTKWKFRHKGVARLLLAPYLGHDDVTYTHVVTTDDDGNPWVRIPEKWKYDPRTNYGLSS